MSTKSLTWMLNSTQTHNSSCRKRLKKRSLKIQRWKQQQTLLSVLLKVIIIMPQTLIHYALNQLLVVQIFHWQQWLMLACLFCVIVQPTASSAHCGCKRQVRLACQYNALASHKICQRAAVYDNEQTDTVNQSNLSLTLMHSCPNISRTTDEHCRAFMMYPLQTKLKSISCTHNQIN